MKEKEAMGFLVATQEEMQIAVKISYIYEFHEPDENDWPNIIKQLRTRFGLNYSSIKQVFTSCCSGHKHPEKQMPGAGRKHKLGRDNPGLIAGAAALNGSTSPNMATMICNAVNECQYPDDFDANYKVCRNTFMATLKAHADFECHAVLRRKTGKEDPGCDWAVARTTLAQQMLEQIEIGKKLDKKEITYLEASFQNPDSPPPIFPDAVLYLDENHTVASLGGVGHDGSFSSKQYFVYVDRVTGALLCKADGGVIPERRFRVIAKFTTEARGCYGVCCPVINSEEKPQFIKTWDYTGKTLVSFKVWKQEVECEMAYRRATKYKGWNTYVGDNPNEERFGENWKMELANSPRMKTKISSHRSIFNLPKVHYYSLTFL
jgi:hypothetical protein